MAKDLMERHELSQKEVAENLGVTQAAVSQHISSVRGNKSVEEKLENSDIIKKILKLSDRIAEEKSEQPKIIKSFCGICNTMKRNGMLCEIHCESVPELSIEECKICFKD